MFRWFIWFNTRIVIPKNYQSQILNVLHSAHQGVNSMMKRANQTVYWPGIMSSIRNMWYKCQICNNIAPSQSKEPLIISKTPQYPFHYICADYFEIKGNHYLAVLDRFSSWIMIYHFPPRKLNHQSLNDLCQEIFTTYGTPEEISSDGGHICCTPVPTVSAPVGCGAQIVIRGIPSVKSAKHYIW